MKLIDTILFLVLFFVPKYMSDDSWEMWHYLCQCEEYGCSALDAIHARDQPLKFGFNHAFTYTTTCSGGKGKCSCQQWSFESGSLEAGCGCHTGPGYWENPEYPLKRWTIIPFRIDCWEGKCRQAPVLYESPEAGCAPCTKSELHKRQYEYNHTHKHVHDVTSRHRN